MTHIRSVVAMGAAMLATAAVARLPKVGEPAPDFTITLNDGSRVSLANLRGQVVVLNFWATWCEPCKAELPLLDGFSRILAPHGLRVYAVTTEDSVPIERLQKLAGVLNIPLVRRIKGPYADLDAVPTNFVIDRRGVVRYAKAASFTLDTLNATLIPLLNEPAPPLAPPPAAN